MTIIVTLPVADVLQRMHVIAAWRHGAQAQLHPVYQPTGLHHEIEEDEELGRFVYRSDQIMRLPAGGTLRTRMWATYYEGAPHLELVLSVENTTSDPPPTGLVEGEFGWFVSFDPGPAPIVLPRYHIAHGLSMPAVGQIVLPIAALGRGQMRLCSVLVDTRDYTAATIRWHSTAVSAIRDAQIDVPAPHRDTSAWIDGEGRKLAAERTRLLATPGRAWPAFGATLAPGASGDRDELGWNPIPHQAIRNTPGGSYVADYLRMTLMMIEPSRPVWWRDIPQVPSDYPDSAYLFGGLHWASRWTAGHHYDAHGTRTWAPPLPETWQGGWRGWNMEHLVSLLPEYAYATQDPWALDLTRDLGWIAANVLTTEDQAHGGYYSAGKQSAREWARPARTMYVCGRATGEQALIDRVVDMVRRRTSDWRGARYAEGPDGRLHWGHGPNSVLEQLDGNAPIYDSWQLGLLAWMRTMIQTEEARGTDMWLSRQMLTEWGQLMLRAWRGTDPTLMQMSKQMLVRDPEGTGVRYGHGLEHWSWGMCQALFGWPGIDQRRLSEVRVAITHGWPEVVRGESKWGCGLWT